MIYDVDTPDFVMSPKKVIN